MKQSSKGIIKSIFVIFILSIFVSSLFFFMNGGHLMINMNSIEDMSHMDHMEYMGNMEDMDEMRESFISLKDDIQIKLLPQGMYRCCLEKPCTYCIEKTPGHGEGAVCNCLEEVVTGIHPCGECIGEILEGHGNPLLSEYFARAIAEKVGEDHIDTLRQIIFEKYGMPVDDQL